MCAGWLEVPLTGAEEDGELGGPDHEGTYRSLQTGIWLNFSPRIRPVLRGHREVTW